MLKYLKCFFYFINLGKKATDMEKKDIDWGNLVFGYIKTDYRYVSNFKDGKGPDVEGLELSRHRKKFNTAYRPYKDKWMKRVASKFGKN